MGALQVRAQLTPEPKSQTWEDCTGRRRADDCAMTRKVDDFIVFFCHRQCVNSETQVALYGGNCLCRPTPWGRSISSNFRFWSQARSQVAAAALKNRSQVGHQPSPLMVEY
eukprot:scaffold330011_cov26-Prasinocladus_malaysianus.AAC.1